MIIVIIICILNIIIIVITIIINIIIITIIIIIVITGLYEVPKDERLASQYYRQAANQGTAATCIDDSDIIFTI